MGFWERQVVPRFINVFMGTKGFSKLRRRTVGALEGEVLEVGFGSGLNVPHYPPAVSVVYAVAPALRAREISADRVAASHADVRHIGLDGSSIPLPDQTCDSALSTFTLCTIPDVGTALREVRRVLRPGGTFHFLEHGLAPDRRVALAQRWLEPVQRRVADGCHLTRDSAGLVRAAGFRLVEVDSRYGIGPSPWSFMTLGVAVVPDE
jgi:ubiquinone/menaquinone biosynthesis C-methylase UbiE